MNIASPLRPEASSQWGRRLTSPWAALAVLAVFFATLLGVARRHSATMDEPLYATAGFTYWKLSDYRIQPENGILPQRLFGLALLAGDFHLPAAETAAWRESKQWEIAYEWIHQEGHDTTALLFRGRAVAASLALALGAVVWLWSRQIFGPIGAMLSLLLYVLNPTILANGALMTSDVGSALFFLLALWAATRALHDLSPPRVLASSVALGALCTTKVSAALLVPVLLVLVVLRALDGRPLALGRFGRADTRGSKALALAGATLAHAVVALAVIWAAYGFRFSAFAGSATRAARFEHPWEWALDKPDHLALLDQLNLDPATHRRAREHFERRGVAFHRWSHDALVALEEVRRTVLTTEQGARLEALRRAAPPTLVTRAAEFARSHRLLPEAFIFGACHVWILSRERTAFFRGEVRTTGWRGFFPFTFLVKTPLATLALLALAAIAALRLARPGMRSDALIGLWQSTAALWLFLAIYWLSAIASHINIGHRHILPTYPPLFVLGGLLAVPLVRSSADPARLTLLARRAFAGLAGLCFLVLGVEMVAWFPSYLAYFNGLVRPARAYRHLVDSSIDWGQDLPALRRYLDQHRNPQPAYLAYFGIANPATYGITVPLIYGNGGFASARTPPMRILLGVSKDQDLAAIQSFVLREPSYDARVLATVEVGGQSGTLLLQQPSALRLTGGTYFISASFVQPVAEWEAYGPWSTAHEATYQQLRATVAPLLSDDLRQRAAALPSRSTDEWLRALGRHAEYRFARLTAFLRQREPDDTINYSILVYQLTDADIARAVDGPPP
ncbi:MAG: glycosyltransferase family 39 protein [Verrucomicrobia bacterium]|nr:glycosyltransferase family 39 protein [Verrucomicrobiota bacterium]